MNNVVSCTRLTSNEWQQKCVHCNRVPKNKFITFDKRNMDKIQLSIEWNDEQNIICNKCHNAICRQSLVTCLTCRKTMKKKCTLKFDINKYSPLQNEILEMPTHREPTLTYARAATYNSNEKLHVCVATDICINMYVKCTTK